MDASVDVERRPRPTQPEAYLRRRGGLPENGL
ncbi:hypothetical protein L916_12648 [Phytophthora nicotianae]|uniref:Uncharacterized protein n=1 Tax=Phytophthora nicotianae TaxID=4792 RepID=W2IM65_PHYNI|nr:hypothetical protein L916_12648 [Phytophthora nicotianae]